MEVSGQLHAPAALSPERSPGLQWIALSTDSAKYFKPHSFPLITHLTYTFGLRSLAVTYVEIVPKSRRILYSSSE
jgi:hypothetical protein